jgi:predicted dehydrogenase
MILNVRFRSIVMSNRRLNVGLVGGAGGFFATPHSKAIHLDGTRRITSVALSSDPGRAMQAADNWPYPVKGYVSYDIMIRQQAEIWPPGQTGHLDYIVIVTPNHAHFDPAMKAIKAGIPVFCEKPLCMNSREARALAKAVHKKGIPFAVAYTYLGHWMTRLAAFIVQSGLIGQVRWVDSSYLQEWLATSLETTAEGTGGKKQATWRTDPARAGLSGCGGDIVGTHAYRQVCYITGLHAESVKANLKAFVSGRKIDDHFTAYCYFNNGAEGLIRGSQIEHGHKNHLRTVIVGTKGSIEWDQEDAEKLHVFLPGQPERVYTRGAVNPGDGFLPKKMPLWLMNDVTLPPGHGEDFHDALARLHRGFEADVRKWGEGYKTRYSGFNWGYATVDDAAEDISFIEACVASSKKDGRRVLVR